MARFHRQVAGLIAVGCGCLIALLAYQEPPLAARSSRESDTSILIEVLHYDGYSYLDADEAVALRNMRAEDADLSGWRLSDGQHQSAEFPAGTIVPGRSLLWLTGDAAAFQTQFGRAPDVVLAQWPGFANDGDEALLLQAEGHVVDMLVYGDGDATVSGWNGAAVRPYSLPGVFAKEGQMLVRKRDEATALPVPDTDQAADWVQDLADPYHGKRVRYPGWETEQFFFPSHSDSPGSMSVFIAPDNAYTAVARLIREAQATLDITSLTFENLALGDELIEAAERGVAVSLLLEGNPVGGVADHEREICRQLEAAGGQCWFMINDSKARIYDRYRYMHAKYMLIDDKLALVSSENFSPNSMPYDDKDDGTWGRRGVLVTTSAPQIVDALRLVRGSDLNPADRQDIFRWQAGHSTYGAPPPGYAPIQTTGGISYTLRYPQTADFHDVAWAELQQAPDNLLRSSDGIFGLLNEAGSGDTVLVQQLQERNYWGPTTSSPQQDPNLRLAAFIAAARRGARVRLMLDDFFDRADNPAGNAATCARLNAIANQENLSLQCIGANPTGLGIHNKMILAEIGGKGYVQIGSWNGTELAAKGNREIALLFQSNDAYAYLAELVERDWPHLAYMPLQMAQFKGYSNHLLISEVLYDPSGPDEYEFIEIVNPTPAEIDLGGFAIGDAVNREDFEDVRRFPAGTHLAPRGVLVVTTSAVHFFDQFGTWPDFEILETTALVPNLIDDLDWGDTAALLQLGNQGDEVILRDATDAVVDVMTYGEGSYPGQIGCPLVTGANHSLERTPYWRDSDNCPADFRDWPFPSPGSLP